MILYENNFWELNKNKEQQQQQKNNIFLLLLIFNILNCFPDVQSLFEAISSLDKKSGRKPLIKNLDYSDN